MVETKDSKIEREYVVPLRRFYQHVPRYKKSPKAIKTLKEFLARHMKIYDRDLRKIKLDRYVNEAIWARGIKKPPLKIKVKAIKEGDVVKVELVNYSKKLELKKKREDKARKVEEEIAKAAAEKKKGMVERMKDSATAEKKADEDLEKKIEENMPEENKEQKVVKEESSKEKVEGKEDSVKKDVKKEAIKKSAGKKEDVSR